MLTYVDTRTGRVVDMPEAPDVEREWVQRARKARRVTDAERIEARGAKIAAAARHTLEKMDGSDRWERVSDSREADRLRAAYQWRRALQRGVASVLDQPATTDTSATSDGDEGDGGVSRPAQSDPKADWIAWAVERHGYTDDDAEAMTKNELMDLPD